MTNFTEKQIFLILYPAPTVPGEIKKSHLTMGRYIVLSGVQDKTDGVFVFRKMYQTKIKCIII
ncbi:hypothetical protein D1164_08140 [Mariniphaga sediminis]|jgi:hypothetical protein|uniref:Uncharacterized protein n=1 Tax=Mariniphaga sediminis TaxID=1628158 RepID=A0A399D2C7_9BACT|nr:hypothetical protein D1164_08140 [Mariniphaga sediminis]